MRQLNSLTNALLACITAAGLVATLALPWFAPAVAAHQANLAAVANGDEQGPMQDFADWVQRVFSTGGHTVSGTDALGSSRSVVLAIGVVVALLAFASLIPAIRNGMRDVVRAVAILSPVLVVVLAVRQGHGLELRYGVVASVATAIFLGSCAWHAAGERRNRVAAIRPATRFSN